MPGAECTPDEEILRAIPEAHWDEAQRRASSSLFEGPNTSVSRLSVWTFEKIVEVFRRELDKPNSKLVKVGQINVGAMQELGRLHSEAPANLTVVVDPLPNNPAHAIVPQRLSRGLARKIVKALRLRDIPFA